MRIVNKERQTHLISRSLSSMGKNNSRKNHTKITTNLPEQVWKHLCCVIKALEDKGSD